MLLLLYILNNSISFPLVLSVQSSQCSFITAPFFIHGSFWFNHITFYITYHHLIGTGGKITTKKDFIDLIHVPLKFLALHANSITLFYFFRCSGFQGPDDAPYHWLFCLKSLYLPHLLLHGENKGILPVIHLKSGKNSQHNLLHDD